MMAQIIRSPEAEADTVTAARFVARESQSRSTAYRFVDTIDEKLKVLARHPQAGSCRPSLGENVRQFPLGDHIILYRPLDDGIEFLRFLHARRDVRAIFRSSGA